MVKTDMFQTLAKHKTLIYTRKAGYSNINSNILIPKSLQPYDLNLQYFKHPPVDITKCLV